MTTGTNTFHELYDAIETGSVDRVRGLLSDNKELINGDGQNPPPLHWAIYHDDAVVAELLVQHGADIEQRDMDRKANSLEYAVVYGRRDAISLLIACEANAHDGLLVADKGAAGGYGEFDQLPTAAEYLEIARWIRKSL